MFDMHHVRVVCVLSPILALLALGFAITLRSGVAQLTSVQGLRLVMANLSRTVLCLVGCLVVLIVLHQAIGFRLGLM